MHTSAARKLGLDDEKPVIFVPISGPLKERAYLISLLQRIFTSFPDDYQVVMSLGHPRPHPTPVQYGNFRVFRWIPNRFEYLKACDIVVSRAGHGTMLQTICYGKPTVLIPTPSHTEQFNNAVKGVELGVALIIDQEDLKKESLLSTLNQVIENDDFAKRALEIQTQVSVADGLET